MLPSAPVRLPLALSVLCIAACGDNSSSSDTPVYSLDLATDAGAPLDSAGDTGADLALGDLRSDDAAPDFSTMDFVVPTSDDAAIDLVVTADLAPTDDALPDESVPVDIQPDFSPYPAPHFTGISPTIGPTSGGTTLTISGDGFVAGALVTIGGKSATGVKVSPSSITCTLPAHPGAFGPVDVLITNIDGQSALGRNQFTYAATLAFASPRSTVEKGSPWALVVADLNHDKILDVVVANNGSNSASVLLGQGGGALGPSSDYAAGNNPYGLDVADYDGDGNLDVALADSSSNDVAILYGFGSGALRLPVFYSVGSVNYAVASSDWNSDGLMDLLIASSATHSVNLMAGGTMGFVADSVIAIGETTRQVLTPDINHDGTPDMVVLSPGHVTTFLSNGSAFGNKQSYTTSGGSQWLATGDFNGDHLIDFAVANYGAANIDIFLNAGGGAFNNATHVTANGKPNAIAAADFNGDGMIDLVTVSDVGASASFVLGSGNGTFGAAHVLGVGGSPTSVVAADLDGDGRPDIVTGSPAPFNVITVLRNASQ